MPKVMMPNSRSPMKQKDLFSDLQSRVLAALASDPLNQARLFESAFRLTCHNQLRIPTNWEVRAPEFFDALSLLQADGLVSEKPHPVKELRRYYLTEKGGELAKRLESKSRKRGQANASHELTPR